MIRIVYLILALYILGSCGFRPLHQSNDFNYDILKSIKVNKIQSDKPYLLRIYLENELNPNNEPHKKDIAADVIITKSLENLVIQSDSTITRKNLVIIASLVLKDLETGEKIDKSLVKVVTSFDEVSSPFASFQKEEKAFDDGMKEIAKSLRDRIIILLNKHDYLK